MRITFDFPHVFSKGSPPLENAQVLRTMLDCLIRVNVDFLRHHTVPALYRSGVVYARTNVWDSIPALYKRTYGDCKSLSAARIAELLHEGKAASPVFRFTERPDMTLYHILVETVGPDGRNTYEDPSKVCGMNRHENAYFPRE